MYVSDLGSFIARRMGVRVLQFADDVCLYISDRDTQATLDVLEQVTISSVDWFRKLGLSVAPEKSQLWVFHRTPIRNNVPRAINVKGMCIAEYNGVRFLGLTLQSNLKWNRHFEEVINRCDKAINVIKFLRTTWYGADPSLLFTIYQGLLRSKI